MAYSALKPYTDHDSYVSTLNGSGPVQFYADALNESTLNINGNASKSIGVTPDGSTYTAKNESADTKGADSTYTRGFHLAGVDIPYPTGDYVQKTGTTSLSDSAALCWVQRCTAEGKVAWVLSLVNGTCPAAQSSISCGVSDTSSTPVCSWEKSTTLTECTMTSSEYCALNDSGVLAKCSAVASLTLCGTAEPASVCKVREQHITLPGCTNGTITGTGSSDTVKVYFFRIYNAKCSYNL